MLKFVNQSKNSVEIYDTATKFYVGELVKKSGVWLSKSNTEKPKIVKCINEELSKLNGL